MTFKKYYFDIFCVYFHKTARTHGNEWNGRKATRDVDQKVKV